MSLTTEVSLPWSLNSSPRCAIRDCGHYQRNVDPWWDTLQPCDARVTPDNQGLRAEGAGSQLLHLRGATPLL